MATKQTFIKFPRITPMGEGKELNSHLICSSDFNIQRKMQNTSDKTSTECKVIALSKNHCTSPQIPDQPQQGILQLYALEYIDQLLDEHFK